MSGSITDGSFNEIPAPWLVPGTWVEVRANYNNVGVLPIPSRILIVGQKVAGGAATALQVYENVTRLADAVALGGPGSQIDTMAQAVFAAQPNVPVDVLAVADAGGAAAARWTLTVSGPATGNGTTAIAIEGTRVSVGTLSGDSANTTAAALAAAINAIPALPVSATVATNVVTVTAKNGGVAGNDISYAVSPAVGDALPAGIGIAVAQTVTGTTNPDSVSVITAISGLWYTDVVIPWQDSTNLGEWAAEATRRYGAMVHQDMRVYFPITGSFSQQLSAAAALNSRFLFGATLAAGGTAPYRLAASLCAVATRELTIDPARQLGDLVLPGVIGPARSSLPDDFEKNLLLQGGCSAFKVRQDGTVAIHRVVSTHSTDANGNIDTAWRDIMGVATYSRIRYDWRAYFATIWPRAKLAQDGSLAADRDPTVCTPRKAKASWTARMQVYAANGWIQNEKADAAGAVFAVDPNDANRLNHYLPITRIGNKMVDAGQLAFNV